MKQEPTLHPITIDILSGLITGMVTTAILNPWDRALYLSIKNRQSFLSGNNFTKPYQGVGQAVIQRGVLGSVYYIMQARLRENLVPMLISEFGFSESFSHYVMGMLAGTSSAIFTNSASAVKYHTWGHDDRTFFSSARAMLTTGSYKAFIKGTKATVLRDMAFGSTYELTRYLLHEQLTKKLGVEPEKNIWINFLRNCLAAGVATIISGPFNLARNLHYATPPHKTPLPIRTVIEELFQESKSYSFIDKFGFFQRRLNIGWGTGRVAVGMALGQNIFDYTREQLPKAINKLNL